MPAFFRSDVARFLETPSGTIVGALSAALIKGFSGDHSRQLAAWRAQVEILRSAMRQVIVLNADAASWGVLFEFPLLRLQRRLDIVLLARSRVVVLEFKVGASAYQTVDVQQVEDYALDLRDFHEASHHLAILPVLCATKGAGPALGSRRRKRRGGDRAL